MASGLEWHATLLWHPGDVLSDLYFLGRIADPQDGEITIPLNDSRRATVTMPILGNDQLCEWLYSNPGVYGFALKAYYNDQLVFWGPGNLLSVDMAARTMQVNAVDPSIRLIHHFLRRGDINGDMTHANGDKATVPIDHVGLRLLRDAGLNTAGQNLNGDPDLGIIDGTNDFVAAPDNLMGVARGDQVWNTFTQLSQALGPDFELEPIEDTAGAYCQLNTFTHQGSDVSADVAFHYGTGKQNLDNLTFTDGSKYITHVHVLDRDGTYRFTEANTSAAGNTGPYVEWDATDFDAHGVSASAAETVLRAAGEDFLNAYSRPLMTAALTLPLESDGSYKYGTDYKVGDTIGVAGKVGDTFLLDEEIYRITQVQLRQANPDNAVQPEIEVVADRAAGATYSGSEE